MAGKAVYLEASERTQDFLNIKWALQSAGYAIVSSWHEGEVSLSSLAFRDHWSARRLEQLQACGWLVVICGNSDRAALELATMEGFAIARGVGVIWIGPRVRCLNGFRAVQEFNTPEDFRKHILTDMYSRSMSLTDNRLAA